MMGPTHRLFGGLAGAAYAVHEGMPLSMTVMASLVGTASAFGYLSPDMDQTKPWIETVGRLPGRIGSHRFGSHWWGLPLLVWWLVDVPPEAVWVLHALLAGWVSHLVGDAIFGKLYVLPWGGPQVGLGLKTDGFVESGVWARKHRILPVSPARLAITVGLGYLLWTAA